MLVKNLYKKIGEAKNWNYDKFITYGYENEYYIQVRQEGMFRVIDIFFQLEDDTQKLLQLDKEILKNKKVIKISNFQVNKNGIIIFPNEFFIVLNLNRLQNILDFVTVRLKELDFKPSLEFINDN
ncbi:Uncharacterised protein [Acholeplasma oculi]|nr:hypothetical protein [Acholeplasma oculi]SKC43420.1 hypothetical protein SAMN02745122_0976 [Acholeplasma oculi]SUT88689.1 Uncharacterised protein [Acholeplasma oculi]